MISRSSAVDRTTGEDMANVLRSAVVSAVSESLSELEVLIVDCQATAAAPLGHLLEIGWARTTPTTSEAHARLIALPNGERIPPAVASLTGISEPMAKDGVEEEDEENEMDREDDR